MPTSWGTSPNVAIHNKNGKAKFRHFLCGHQLCGSQKTKAKINGKKQNRLKRYWFIKANKYYQLQYGEKKRGTVLKKNALPYLVGRFF